MMRRIIQHTCCAVWFSVMSASVGGAQQTPREIVDRVDQLLRGRSSRGSVQMDVVTEHWTRSMRMQIWSLGTDNALIRILSPMKDAGTATLKVDQQIWNYLPRVDRTIRIPASLMGGPWMGSHFTNDDLVKESRIIEDYEIAIEFEGEREGWGASCPTSLHLASARP